MKLDERILDCLRSLAGHFGNRIQRSRSRKQIPAAEHRRIDRAVAAVQSAAGSSLAAAHRRSESSAELRRVLDEVIERRSARTHHEP
jgi:hypothetical protein